ncbi:hypothetical protein SAMN06265348_111206 [Pedobacter westerhofensis]|uniref:DUF6268 domain-containing protein n=1 Tax=Pedobacter westerhofensis TaxID=425512 RepID=A0A521FE66_9SPHI|nr:hypothetical protein [Pedobacter westerhofensis]SMO94389.1 hypothetical protein SAMN06265348_111206 [Pedobacter westerhofensis]
MKYLFIAILLNAFISNSTAQTAQQSDAKKLAVQRMTDSLKMEALSGYAQLYPQLRQGFFSADFIGNANVHSELNGKDLYDGKMKITRIRTNFNLPLAQWGRNRITGTLGYQQQHLQTTEINSFNPEFSALDRDITKSAGSFTATFSRSDSIFNKQVIYSAGISGISDEFSSVKRVNYIGTVTVPLKRSRYSSLTVGMAIFIDPSAVSPVIPIISYWHKFKERDLDLFVDLPSRISLRKQLSKRSSASLGSELGGTLLFFDVNQPSLPQNTIYTNVEVRSGATFEYLATKKLILGINGGIYSTTASRMFDHNAKPDSYFYRSQAGSVPYVSFSVSFLPFISRL